MEINHFSGGNSDKLEWSSDELQGSSSVKSYSCTFCKRGFSNAQALGGHMNIHRKERAKLRVQASGASGNLLALDITCRSANTIDPPQAFEDQEGDLFLQESERRRRSLLKRACLPSIDDVGVEEPGQHPLFSVDTEAGNFPEGTDHQYKRMQLMSHGFSQEELDLELRLGTEPHEKLTTSTREFI
ncbi:hypothetical protein Tsubulata_002797 [Turnera subulata]|uniref:C2H2-type domain-containing protein n=1 Tax=Turnera subulata TaxID=218843 RepID=A0A9Q0FPD9_9ROSI|nr:hypothetical protein Tsubulata_002797 [Turnera subulata]